MKAGKWVILALLLVMVMPAAGQEGRPDSYKLDVTRLSHLYQNWNNCGPATLTMGLSYFGFPAGQRESQQIAQDYLKPDIEDQNVSPWQMVDYVNNDVGLTYNIRAIARRGGDVELIKTLLASDFPIVIEEGFEPEGYEWMGHYLLLIGYDDTQQVFYTLDSFLGPGGYADGGPQGLPKSYAQILTYWRHFNNAFIVLYAPEREAELQTLMGDMWDEQVGWQRAKEVASAEAAANPGDHWAWFNLGEAMTYLGDYNTATIAYRTALDTRKMPWRTLWYLHGAFESFYQTGQFNTVLQLAELIQVNTPYIEEANYYRGLVYAAQGNTDQALYRLNLVLDFNPNFTPAAQAIAAIEAGTFAGPIQTDAAG
jgi:tetratricopeptide (TPR) repeat protein